MQRWQPLCLLLYTLWQGSLWSQNQLLLYSDESEMFRLISPPEIKTAQYHNLIQITALPFQEFKLTMMISGVVIEKNVKLLKEHLSYYALSKEGANYHLRYRGALPVEIPMPIYLKSRNHRWEIVYQKDQFLELEELIPVSPQDQKRDSVTRKPRSKNTGKQAMPPKAALKLQEVTTPKAILDLIRASNATTPRDISDLEFEQHLGLLQKANTDSEKLILGKNLFQNTSLNISQIILVCGVFTHDFSKADFAIFAYASCSDPENYQELLKIAHFELIKTLLNRETSPQKKQ